MHNRTATFKLALMLLGFLIFSVHSQVVAYSRNLAGKDEPLFQKDTTTINRILDIKNTSRNFPKLLAFRNTSLQKAPAPVIAEVSEKELGRPEITRCWLNLDEMWDYRSGNYTFNYKIGIDKYKNVKEKHRETWDWELESPVNYYDYLKAFSTRSDEIMLNIRRYERDVLDGKLPITMQDWKRIFKEGLKHYKMLYANIRYVELGNEYGHRFFMKATAEEYYQFYKLGYESVNEVNQELGLVGKQKILIGGPVVTGGFIKPLTRFFEQYQADETATKSLDFVSWHEYSIPAVQTAFREKEIRNMLLQHGMEEQLPLFVSEHNPYHYYEDKLAYHHQNSAGLIKTLYFSSLYSPNLKIMPWVLYHNSKLQTRFMWFDGPNDPETAYDQIKIFPSGISMKWLAMHQGKEILVDNDVTGNDLVIASRQPGRILVEAVNFGSEKSVIITLKNLKENFETEKLIVKKYLLDKKHNNILTDPNRPPQKIDMLESATVELYKTNELVLRQGNLETDGIVFWEIGEIQ